MEPQRPGRHTALKIHSWILGDRIGEGGMAEVFAARHEHLPREAVVKLLFPVMQNQPGMYNRFLDEARAAGKIDHHGLAKVFDCGYDESIQRAFIVMERLHGETLQVRMGPRNGPRNGQSDGHPAGVLSIPQTYALIRELAEVMRVVHAKEIVHRDLKPSNIFLARDAAAPGDERVKVLDFGLAKLLPDSSLTAPGTVFGTPPYMAPEQLEDSASVDHRADLYSIGCLFYCCLCGRPPFTGNALELWQKRFVAKPPVPPSRIRAEIPETVDRLILRLLAKEPDERVQSCDELYELIDELGRTGRTRVASRPSRVDPDVTVVDPSELDAFELLGVAPVENHTINHDIGELSLVEQGGDRLDVDPDATLAEDVMPLALPPPPTVIAPPGLPGLPNPPSFDASEPGPSPQRERSQSGEPAATSPTPASVPSFNAVQLCVPVVRGQQQWPKWLAGGLLAACIILAVLVATLDRTETPSAGQPDASSGEPVEALPADPPTPVHTAPVHTGPVHTTTDPSRPDATAQLGDAAPPDGPSEAEQRSRQAFERIVASASQPSPVDAAALAEYIEQFERILRPEQRVQVEPIIARHRSQWLAHALGQAREASRRQDCAQIDTLLRQARDALTPGASSPLRKALNGCRLRMAQGIAERVQTQYIAGRAGTVAQLCSKNYRLLALQPNALGLCGITACVRRDEGAAKRYYELLPPARQKEILAFCSTRNIRLRIKSDGQRGSSNRRKG